MNINHKMIKIAFIMFYALSILLVPSISHGESTIVSEITGNGPQINGNLTGEWDDAVAFDTTFNGADAHVYVQVNGTHVFIGFNYTLDSPLIEVNDTIPIGSSLGYNNATHDWLALQFDNNLDQQNIGTASSPDDIISVDQYRSEAFDGFINGNSTHPLLQDVNVTGTDDSVASRSNFTDIEIINDITQKDVYITAYEFSKPLFGDDINGSDLNIANTNILQFKFIYWMNQTANASIASSQSTEWFTLRLDDKGTGLSTKTINETRIDLLLDQDDQASFNAFSTIIEQYGFNLATSFNNSRIDPSTNDLSVVVLGDESGLTTTNLQNLIDEVKIGSSLIIFLNPELSVSSSISSLFGLEYLTNDLIVPGSGVNESLTSFSVTASNLPFVSSESSVTNRTVGDISLSSSGFNISTFNEQKFVLSQNYHLYDLFGLPANLVYDADGDAVVGVNETQNGISAGVAIDLLKGGRVVLFPSSDVITNDILTQGDFVSYLLRLLPWNARTVNTLEVDSIELDRRNVSPGKTITIELNITDGLGNQLDNNQVVNITSRLILGGGIASSAIYTGSGSNYTGSLDVTRTGFMRIETYAFLSGYGFVQAVNQDVVSEASSNNFNDLDELSFILVIIFVATIGLLVYLYQRTKSN